jgi:CheY-like chemotaxis protein
MPENGWSVLVVEDAPETVSTTVAQLRAADISVDEVGTLGEAEHRVSKVQYSLLLVDLRVPQGDDGVSQGGLEFVKNARAGRFGEFNRNTPAVLLTAYVYDISKEDLEKVRGFVIKLGKLSPVLKDIRLAGGGLLDWLPVQRTAPSQWVVEDLLIVRDPVVDGHVIASVSRWPGGDSVRLTVSELPDEIQQELAYPENRPLLISALINKAARTEDQVKPHRLRIRESDAELEREFDTGGERV